MSVKTRVNDVDSWIDELDDSVVSNSGVPSIMDDINPNAMAGWLVQKYLPKMELPTFNGSPHEWVNFIVKFRDIVHNQQYLSCIQKNILLLQHLKGEAHRAVRAFGNNAKGYIWSLRKLKYLFGQRSAVAKAVLEKATKGKIVQNDDFKALSELYYSISDCLTILNQLNYESDLKSSDTLRQVLIRLPRSLQMKWGEHSLSIKQHEEPSLVHLERWLHKRVLARKEANLQPRQKKDDSNNFTGALEETSSTPSCQLCNEAHSFWKCNKYKEMSAAKKWEFVKNLRRCFNCLGHGHQTQSCTSQNTCFKSGCKQKHHTSLHDYFTGRGGSRKAENNKRKNDQKKSDAAKASKKEDAKGGAPDSAVKQDGASAVVKEDVDEESNLMNTQVDQAESEGKFSGATKIRRDVYLQIVPVMLHGNHRKLNTQGWK